MKLLSLIVVPVLLGFAGPALAACPPPLAGDTAAEIRANELRMVCLQRELAAETRQRHQQLEIDGLNQRLRMLQMQRQLDALDFDIPVYRPNF